MELPGHRQSPANGAGVWTRDGCCRTRLRGCRSDIESVTLDLHADVLSSGNLRLRSARNSPTPSGREASDSVQQEILRLRSAGKPPTPSGPKL